MREEDENSDSLAVGVQISIPSSHRFFSFMVKKRKEHPHENITTDHESLKLEI